MLYYRGHLKFWSHDFTAYTVHGTPSPVETPLAVQTCVLQVRQSGKHSMKRCSGPQVNDRGIWRRRPQSII